MHFKYQRRFMEKLASDTWLQQAVIGRNASRGNDMSNDIGGAKVKPCQENEEVLKRSK